jgi:hypothetical protein
MIALASLLQLESLIKQSFNLQQASMIITFMKELASKGIECAIVCHLNQFPPVIISSMLALCWFDCWTMTFSSFLSPRSGMRKNDIKDFK